MSFPRYPKYKNTGVEWLGEVPTSWAVVPVKSIAKIINGFPFDSALFDSDEGIPLVRIRDLDQADTEARYRGDFVPAVGITSADVLIGMDGDFNVGRWRGHGPALLNQRMCCVRGINENVTRYLAYVLPVPLRLINDVTYSTTVKHLSSPEVERMRVAIPADDGELAALLDFLDRETTGIDTLIAEQKRLIDLLDEKREAVISHVVSRGLSPDTCLRESGVDWLGPIPEHWAVSQSRRLFKLRNEPASVTDKQLTASQKYGVIYQDDFMVREGQRVVQVVKGADILKHVEPNDFVISMRSFQGGIEWCQLRGCTSSAYVILTPRPEVHCGFFSYLFKSQTYIQALQTTSNLVRDGQALRFANFAQVRLPVVPWAEQAAIAAYLDDETTKIDGLLAEANRIIRLLEERKGALISAAVTGKIDVRNYAADQAEAA